MTRFSDLIAETVVITGYDGSAVPAYLARPLGPDPRPGVVMIHHRHGFDWASLEMVRRFASEGYACIMPNLHHRYGPDSTPMEAAEAVLAAGGITDAECIGDVEGAMAYLSGQPFSTGKVGVVGFCSGGKQAYLAAATLPFSATVACYGGRIVPGPEDVNERTPVPPIDLTEHIESPVLWLSGADDRRPSPDEAAQVKAALEKHGKINRFVIFENAGHAFFGVDRDLYRPEAAKRGWAEIMEWLEKYLVQGIPGGTD
jgi:carboxymethylenebutenolidase